jgi:ABC-type branched-subunit amino acid transport system substrate-binding protein
MRPKAIGAKRYFDPKPLARTPASRLQPDGATKYPHRAAALTSKIPEETEMSFRQSVLGIASFALATLFAGSAFAQDSVKIGLILPMTGPQASTGKQIDAGVKLYMQQHGTTVAGKKIEVILKDDGAVPDNTKRLARSSSSMTK